MVDHQQTTGAFFGIPGVVRSQTEEVHAIVVITRAELEFGWVVGCIGAIVHVIGYASSDGVTQLVQNLILPAMPDCTCKALVLVPANTTGLPNTCCQLNVRLELPPALLLDKAASSTNGPLLATTADCCTLATGKGLASERAA